MKAILEIKSYVYTPTIFGTKLALDFKRKKEFLPSEASYILFAFELYSGKTNYEIIEKLKEICDRYAIVLRYESKTERERGKEEKTYNFDNSVSRLIQWLRNLS